MYRVFKKYVSHINNWNESLDLFHHEHKSKGYSSASLTSTLKLLIDAFRVKKKLMKMVCYECFIVLLYIKITKRINVIYPTVKISKNLLLVINLFVFFLKKMHDIRNSLLFLGSYSVSYNAKSTIWVIYNIYYSDCGFDFSYYDHIFEYLDT